MNTKFVAAVAVLTALTVTVAHAQDVEAPKVSKAEVQTAIDKIKSDNAKFAQFCDYASLLKQASALAAKNENDPKLEALNSQMDEIVSKSGPEAQKILDAELDEESHALLQDLAKTCK